MQIRANTNRNGISRSFGSSRIHYRPRIVVALSLCTHVPEKLLGRDLSILDLPRYRPQPCPPLCSFTLLPPSIRNIFTRQLSIVPYLSSVSSNTGNDKLKRWVFQILFLFWYQVCNKSTLDTQSSTFLAIFRRPFFNNLLSYSLK